MGHVVRSAGLLIAATAFTACSPPAVLPSPPATPSASAIAQGAAGCPSASGVAVPDLTDGMAPADAVSAYLEAGGDPTALAASLFDLGWGSPNSTVVWTDIDADGNLDFAAGLTGAPDAQGIAEDGSVYLWRCQDGAYLRAEIAPPRPDFGPPAIHAARDLTVDGLPELIVAYPLCGAHTCFAQFAVYQWDGAEMVDRFQGASDDMPFPELAIEADDPSSPAAIEITATGIGSVGAGPYRTWSRAWTWDGEARAFVPGEPVIEAPRFRIHIIHDADDAYLRGDLEAAVELYQRAIDDDALLDWPAAGARRQELAAYAAFRRVLSFLAGGDRKSAQAELDLRLTGTDATSAAYSDLARHLIAGYADDALTEACVAVPSFVSAQAEAVLSILDFGYANRTYAAEDICPMIDR